MSLPEQADLLDFCLRNWLEPKPNDPFKAYPIWLSSQDAADLRIVAKTLRILGMHGADQYVREKVAKEKKERGRR